MNFTPVDADQLSGVVYFALFLRFSIPGEEEGDGVVTRNDLSEFRTFLLEQLKAHNRDFRLSSTKPLTRWGALSASQQLKKESALKFVLPVNERNFKFNLEILDLLESSSKSIKDQDSAKAAELIGKSIQSLKERNRKIRITDSSDGGWLTVKHCEGNAVAQWFRGRQKTKREALRENNRIRSRRQNSQHLQDEVCRILSPSAPVVSSSVGSSRVQPVDNNSTLLVSPSACEEFAVSVVPFGHWWRECPVRLARTYSVGSEVHSSRQFSFFLGG